MKEKLLLKVEVIPHETQKYETPGNWIINKDGSITIQVSYTGDDNYSFLIGIHEAIEAWLCRMAGISQKDVDEFDEAYELARLNYVKAPCGCMPTEDSEPGHDRHAPYNRQHKFAESIERTLAKKLMVEWREYDRTVREL